MTVGEFLRVIDSRVTVILAIGGEGDEITAPPDVAARYLAKRVIDAKVVVSMVNEGKLKVWCALNDKNT